MRALPLDKLACGCVSWIEGVDVHVRSCGAPQHYEQLLAAARQTGLPVEEVES